MSFLTRAYFYEKTLNGSFDSQPHEYRMETDEFPTAEKLHDLIFQAIEIEGMESEFLLETLVEENDEYYSSDECVVTPEIVRTSEPSKFIMWENRIPISSLWIGSAANFNLMNCEVIGLGNKIYTHDEAMLIVELFEDILTQHNIKVPSPEDDEREPDNDAALYGSTYSDLLDSVEDKLIEILERHTLNTKVIRDEFSGTV